MKEINKRIFVNFFGLFVLLINLFLLSSCFKPTYPKEKISEMAQKLLKKEANLDSQVKLVGRTLYLEIEIPQLISFDLELPKKIYKDIQAAMLTIVRISLSSDAKIEFLVTIAKSKNFDFCVRIMQKLEDIKKFIYMNISRSDYEERLIFEMIPYSKVDYKDINLNEFAARLIFSKYNMLLKTNPFVSALLENTFLEYNKETDDTIIAIANNQINNSLKSIFQELLLKAYSDVLKKYSILNFPSKIKIIDRNNNELFSITKNQPNRVG